jgi:Zn ribbon nucleic-acid-binding protein
METNMHRCTYEYEQQLNAIQRALGDKCEHCGGTDDLALWPTLRAGRISLLCLPCGFEMELADAQEGGI